MRARLSTCIFLLLPLLANQNRLDPGMDLNAEKAVLGIDVSHYQDRVAWDTIAADNRVEFAFVKATEAHDYVDSLFCYNWEALRHFGIRRGAYHFFRAYGCGEDQARHFLNVVDFQPGDLAPVLDIERADGIPADVLREEARAWLHTVEKQLKVKPIIYSSQNFYENFLAGHFDHYPLWIARYSNDEPLLSTCKRWDFWQFSNKGKVGGIPDFVDLNIFKGSTNRFEQLCWFPERQVMP